MDLGLKWTALMPRHARVLADLRKQLDADAKRMVAGASAGWIGWGGLKDQDERFTDKVLFDPLLDRKMIEKGTDYRPAGHLFCRVTPFGRLCLDLGLQPRHPIKTGEDFKELTVEAQTTIAERDKAKAATVTIEGKPVSAMSNAALYARVQRLEDIVLQLAGVIQPGAAEKVAEALGRTIEAKPSRKAAPKSGKGGKRA